MVKLTVQSIRNLVRYKPNDFIVSLIQDNQVTLKTAGELRQVTKGKHRKDYVTIIHDTYIIERGRLKRPGGIVKVEYQKILDLHAQGMRQTDIAKMLGLAKTTVWRVVHKKRVCQNET